MQDNFFKQQLIAAVLLFLSFLAVVFLLYKSDDIGKYRLKSQNAIQHLNLMLLDVYKCEAGVRGFLMTQNFDVQNRRVESYAKSIREHFNFAKNNLGSTKSILHKLHDIEVLVNHRIDLIKNLKAHTKDSSLSSKKFVNKLIVGGDEIMDNLVPIISEITREQNDKISHQDSELNSIKTALMISLPFVLAFSAMLYFGSLKQTSELNKALKKDKDRLNDEREYYQFLFEKNPVKIFMLDKGLRIKDCNLAFGKFFNVNKEEIKGESINTFLNTHVEGGLNFDFSEKVEVKSSEYEISVGGKKKVVLFDISWNLIKETYFGTLKDITLRKRWEGDLKAAEKMSLTGGIARSIAHEIRNPLTNINLAVVELEDEVSDDANTLLDLITRNSNRIGQLITDLLQSSKSKNLTLSKFKLSQLVSSLEPLVKDRLLLKGIRLEFINLTSGRDTILANFTDLQTAVVNLVINAIEAIDHTAGKITLELSNENDDVRLSIADNGRGIPLDKIEEIFNPFYTSKKKGNGLGLTSVQSTIKSYNGRISVDSKQDVGTVFSCYFAAVNEIT